MPAQTKPTSNSTRTLTFAQAIREATDQLMSEDPNVFLIGEGVPDPKTVFGTTSGLREKFGAKRVFDMPVSENGMTGVAIGAAIRGLRPIMVHQRIDFMMYAMDQLVNNASKWHSMFGGLKPVPLTVRAIIGRGWGQGNQHSQNLEAFFAHVPGLKVVSPSTAYTAKGLLTAAVRDNNPVIFIEHRWVHSASSVVPEESYEIPIGKARIAREGKDITIATWSYMTLECLKTAEFLAEQGISAEIVDMMTLKPMDFDTLKKSVRKTGRLLVVNEAWRHGGLAGELLASVSEDSSVELRARPQRLTNPDFPSPSSYGHIHQYYTTVGRIFDKAAEMVGAKEGKIDSRGAHAYDSARIIDVPDKNFTGPF